MAAIYFRNFVVLLSRNLKIKISLTLRNESTHEEYKKRVLWRIFVCKMEEVTEGWKKNA